jgi:transposase-like protein
MPRRCIAAPYSLRRRWTVDDAHSALAELAASGLSVDAFARQEGLDAQRLYRWQRRLAGERHDDERAAAPEVVEIRARTAAPVEIVLVSGRMLRVSETIDVAALARLVATLERT